MTRIIHIAGNSGSGKTVLALNLGISLSQGGREVILVDGNIYSPDVANYSDISPGIFLNDFLNGHKSINETIMFHPSGMKLIPSIGEEEYKDEKHKKLNKGLLDLVGAAEIVLVDSFSHNHTMFSVLDSADETIFVTNDDLPSIVKAKEFIRKLELKGMSVTGVIVNKRREITEKKHIEAVLEKPVIAEIPFDEKLIDSINNRQPLILAYPNAKVSKAMKGLAELIDTER